MHPWFDKLVVLLIVVNSLFLGIMNYDDPENKTAINKVVAAAEPVFVIAFTVECICKILGMGFVMDPGSYL